MACYNIYQALLFDLTGVWAAMNCKIKKKPA